ncbi:hypothetical protein ADP64_000002 [Achromobacter phage phiAxp-2]|uniref:Uncharacterized protein n=1 Tax=Achromobacter phage phiAxp-2 TaxID=1664246 RepID=A0A0K2FII7_9CAUD|nr:hypothetical protein ADP64_000002 [Achromobacter phage phiAxp-2]ALA45468.1 hypothetical protein ADP64_000002 [Achromobacter phage phiAxp-2]
MTFDIAPPVLPAWAANKQQPAALRKRNILRFLFNYACLYIEPNLTLRQLAVQCGMTETAITAAIGRGDVSEEMAQLVESLAGSKHFSAEWLLDPMQLTK